MNVLQAYFTYLFYSVLCIRTLHFADLGKTSLSPYSPQSIEYGSLKHMILSITWESPKPSPRYPWIPECINSWSLCLWTCYYPCLLCSAQLWSKHETHFLIDFHKNPFRIWAKHHLSHGTANNFLFISQLPISSGFFVTAMSQHSLLALQSARPQYLIWFCFSLLCSYFLPFTSCPNSTASLMKSNSRATVPFPKFTVSWPADKRSSFKRIHSP